MKKLSYLILLLLYFVQLKLVASYESCATNPLPTLQNIATNTSCAACWSEYSECFPGTVSDPTAWKDRILQFVPAQFSGEICPQLDSVHKVQTESCTSTETEIIDLASVDCDAIGKYKCGNGRCIPDIYRCNGDNDCGDYTDEYPTPASKCPEMDPLLICGLSQSAGTSSNVPQGERFLTGISGLNQFATGFDILTSDRKQNVLSMDGHGSCRKVLKAGTTDTYYRLPANVASFQQMMEIEVDDAQLVENGPDLINKTKAKLRYGIDFGGELTDISGEVGYSQAEVERNTILTELLYDQQFAYSVVDAFVDTASINLKSASSLEPSTQFISRVMELPYSSFSNQKYMQLIEDFGTHYVTSGTLGGAYKQVDRYSRCWLESTEYETYDTTINWRNNLASCSKESFYNGIAPDPTITLVSTWCRKTGSVEVVTDEAMETTISVVGGTVEASSNLKFLFGKESWDAWVETVPNSPVLNKNQFKLERLSSLMTSNAIPFESYERRNSVQQLLDQAIDMYLQVYDTRALCAPCPTTFQGLFTDDELSGDPYLTGTGRDYRCECQYPQPLIEETCGAVKSLAMLTLTIMCALLAIWNSL